MKPIKRLEAIYHWKTIFAIPTIIYFPAFLLSIAVIVLSFFVEPFSPTYLIGGIVTALLFAILILVGIIIPATRGIRVQREGITALARVIKREKRSHFATTLSQNSRISMPSTIITFEFTPEGATTAVQMEAEVAKVTPAMQEGKMMKITYAKTNPRIVKLPGE